MADITIKAKKGRTGQTSSEQLKSILNWAFIQQSEINAYLNVVKKQFDESDDDDDYA